jgi:hypothetical protein
MDMRNLVLGMLLATAATTVHAQEAEPEVAVSRADVQDIARAEERVQVADRGEGRRGSWGNVMGRGARDRSQAPRVEQSAPAPSMPQQRWNGGDGMRGDRFRNRGGDAVVAAPVVPQPVPQAQNRQDRGNWDGNRGNRGNWGNGEGRGNWEGRNRGDEGRRNWEGRNRGEWGNRGGVVPVPPQPGSSIDRNGDGRVDRYYDRNRNGRLDRNWDRNRDGSLDRRWDRNRNGELDRRWDRNDNDRLDRRFDRDRDGRYDRYDRRDDRFGRNWNNWNRGWRNDRRYDWNGHRNRYRHFYSVPRYSNPYGYGYGYRRFSVGIYLDSLFYSNRYWVNDPFYYRLPTAPYGARWVRYYNDVLLVDVDSGYVIDVIHNFFW